jgi:DNA adenine methylase
MKTPIKYIGSKAGLIDEISSYVPEDTTVIVEPFAGSGAFSFSSGSPFYLIDNQPELINFYEVLINKPSELILELESMKKLNCEEFFMEVRSNDRGEHWYSLGDVVRAARYYYILYAGYNGMYRVNKKNQANVPWGGDSRKFSVPEEKLLDASEYMKSKCRGVFRQQFDNLSIITSILDAGERPFVLIDPPYVDGDNGKKVYREYTDDTIDEVFYHRLYEYLIALDIAGVPFLMTNTYARYIRRKFRRWNIHKVPTKYTVAADKTKRGEKFEAWVTNIPMV